MYLARMEGWCDWNKGTDESGNLCQGEGLVEAERCGVACCQERKNDYLLRYFGCLQETK